jgi:hypothetical protein
MKQTKTKKASKKRARLAGKSLSRVKTLKTMPIEDTVAYPMLTEAIK